jgi:DNA-binding phage protein
MKLNKKVIEYSPTQELLDESFIAQAVWECLKNNDPEGVVEIIETHLEVVNKVKTTQKNELSRSTMYHALRGKNPTIKTLAKMINCFSSAEYLTQDCCIAHK